jgi:predicted NUDIX family NTP pyrophosphohydrolase
LSADAAGLLLFRTSAAGTEVFLVHPGGPYWRNKDDGAWSIPKGVYEADEDPLTAARREFTEETGFVAEGPFIPLGEFKIRANKIVTAFAAEGDCAPERLVSNTFSLEWPRKSGRFQDFPEVDRGSWFDEETALRKISPGQRAIIAAFHENVIRQKPAPAHGRARSIRRRTGRSAAQAPNPPRG